MESFQNKKKDSRSIEFNSLHDYTMLSRRRVFYTMLIIITSYLAMGLTYLFIIRPSMPEWTAQKYADYLRLKDYGGGMGLYINVPEVGGGDIKRALEEKYGSVSAINLSHVTKAESAGTYDAILNIEKNGEKYQESFQIQNTKTSLYGLKKEWKVIFPLKVQDVFIKGISGTAVYIDNRRVGEIGNTRLRVPNIISGKHIISGELPGIAKMEGTSISIGDTNNEVDLIVSPTEEFTNKMKRLVDDFCKGWVEYCLYQDTEAIRPYLSERLYEEYIMDTDRFEGSKYMASEYKLEYKDLLIQDKNSVSYTVVESWHIKEIITDSRLVFKENNKNFLEQNQYITWKYYIVNAQGTWRMDSGNQLEFKQEILN